MEMVVVLLDQAIIFAIILELVHHLGLAAQELAVNFN